MAKLKSNQILVTDLLEYLNSHSDFSFELEVLKMLHANDIECEHGGHYEDPVTNKSREFDIRATKTIQSYRVRMAIECKNIRENFPILISCVPRHKQESYHQIAWLWELQPNQHSPLQSQSRSTTLLRICGEHSLYKLNEPVGKSTVQVGRTADGNISANDSELYEKWGQCLSSANDLIDRMRQDGHNDKEDYKSAVIPIVVVPNGRLWMVTYDDEGNRVSNPEQVDRCSCFIGKHYEIGTQQMVLSHVEIVTLDGMRNFVDRYLKTEDNIKQIFPDDGIRDAHHLYIKNIR